jgi:hypothetical protein
MAYVAPTIRSVGDAVTAPLRLADQQLYPAAFGLFTMGLFGFVLLP